MYQISFFDKNYMEIIHKTVQAVKQTFVTLTTKVCNIVKVAKGWKFKEVVIDILEV